MQCKLLKAVLAPRGTGSNPQIKQLEKFLEVYKEDRPGLCTYCIRLANLYFHGEKKFCTKTFYKELFQCLG